MCPATLQHLLTWSKFFFLLLLYLDSLEFSLRAILLSKNRVGFIHSFLICGLLVSFSCHIALTRTPSLLLSMNGEARHYWLVHNVWEELVSPSPLRMVLVAADFLFLFFSQMFFIKLKYFPCTPSSWIQSLTMNGLEFVQHLFCIAGP